MTLMSCNLTKTGTTNAVSSEIPNSFYGILCNSHVLVEIHCWTTLSDCNIVGEIHWSFSGLDATLR